MKRFISPKSIVAVTVSLVVVVGAGISYAAIPSNDGTISGCYDKQGRLRVIDAESGATCEKNETALSWNQKAATSGIVRLGDVTLSDGETRVVLSQGPLTITANCRFGVPAPPNFSNPLPQDQAYFVVSTTEDHSAFSVIRNGTPNSDFSATTPEADRVALTVTIIPSGSGKPGFQGTEFSAAAPDGTQLSGVLNAGVNALNRPGKCTFGGSLIIG